MKCHARIVAGLSPTGTTSIVEMTESPPLGIRITRDAVYLVGTAQGLLGDDEVTLDIVVGEGATLAIRSAAATIAYASHRARFQINATVAAHGKLDWQPEPLIATSGCRLEMRATIDLEQSAQLLWRDESVLGRHGEGPGDIDLAVSVDHGGLPLIRHQLTVGPSIPGWDGPAGCGGNRAIGYYLAVGDELPMVQCGDGWAVFDVAGPAVIATAIGRDLIELHDRMAFAGAASHATSRS